MEKKYKFDSENHVHTLDGNPLIGTSTVMGIVAKPLTWWASGLACEKMGWTNGKKRVGGKYITIPLQERVPRAEAVLEQIKGMSTEEYLKFVDEAYKAHSVKLDKSAEAGTDMHAVMEKYVKECLVNGGKPIEYTSNDPKLQIFIDWALANVDHFLYSEMYCYSEKLWVGGISDCGFVDKNGNVGIIDFKSSKEAYMTQFMQIAGYAIELAENGGFDAEGNKVFELEKLVSYYCVLPFGMEKPEVVYNYDTLKMQEGFTSALSLHKIINSSEVEK